jgi:hypothetical protein
MLFGHQLAVCCETCFPTALRQLTFILFTLLNSFIILIRNVEGLRESRMATEISLSTAGFTAQLLELD